jgi:hypothetical protein
MPSHRRCLPAENFLILGGVLLLMIGHVAVLKLDSRYKLPSGDEEPMSIPKGNRKLKGR